MCQNVLVLGLGQVGGSIFGLLRDDGRFSVFGCDIDQDKMRRMGIAGLPDRVDVMHICYPCVGQDEFVKITADYVNRFEPGLTIIESTVPPGTTRKVYEAAKRCIAHSDYVLDQICGRSQPRISKAIP
jgi:UDP-N-acetyl-D-mannosaminuronate dehydrogenase